MMIATRPEDAVSNHDPEMWAVWMLDSIAEELRYIRVLPSKADAEALVAHLSPRQAGCFSAPASTLFDAVQQQGFLAGRGQLVDLLKEMHADVKRLAPAQASDVKPSAPDQAPTSQWWRHGGD